MERDGACDDHTSNPKFAFGRMLFQMLIVMIDMAQLIDVVMGLWMQAARSVRHLALSAFIDQPIQEEYHRHAHEDCDAHDKDRPLQKDRLGRFKAFDHQLEADDRDHHTARCTQ